MNVHETTHYTLMQILKSEWWYIFMSLNICPVNTLHVETHIAPWSPHPFTLYYLSTTHSPFWTKGPGFNSYSSYVLFMLSTKYIGIQRCSINVILTVHQLYCIDKLECTTITCMEAVFNYWRFSSNNGWCAPMKRSHHWTSVTLTISFILEEIQS